MIYIYLKQCQRGNLNLSESWFYSNFAWSGKDRICHLRRNYTDPCKIIQICNFSQPPMVMDAGGLDLRYFLDLLSTLTAARVLCRLTPQSQIGAVDPWWLLAQFRHPLQIICYFLTTFIFEPLDWWKRCCCCHRAESWQCVKVLSDLPTLVTQIGFL